MAARMSAAILTRTGGIIVERLLKDRPADAVAPGFLVAEIVDLRRTNVEAD